MNEIDFVRLARTLSTGDVVLFLDVSASGTSGTASRGADHDTKHGGGVAFEPAAPEVRAAGIVLTFVDPAKPLLVFYPAGSRDGGGSSADAAFGIDFFQDVLYAAEPSISAESFAVWRPAPDAAGAGEANRGASEVSRGRDVWRSGVAAAIGMPLSTETERFDAYSSGSLSGIYPDPFLSSAAASEPTQDGDLGAWVDAHLSVMGVSRADLVATVRPVSVWEEHDVFTFT
jgi:hypothetical protein